MTVGVCYRISDCWCVVHDTRSVTCVVSDTGSVTFVLCDTRSVSVGV